MTGKNALADGTPPQAASLPNWIRTFGRGLTGALILFLLAELVTNLGLVPVEYLPHATSIVASMGALLMDSAFLMHVGATLAAWALGLGGAIIFAIPLGIALGSSETLYRATSPLVEFMRPIPAAALIPLAILLLGQSLSMKIALVAYATAWPILYNTIYGVHDVDPVAVQTARAFGLSRLAVMRRAVLPSAAPLIFTGVRISASLGLVVVVGAELLAAATSGIGSYILNVSASGGNMDKVYAAATVSGLLGVLINLCFAAIDQRAFKWRDMGSTDRS